jgi:hypothetical protein
LSNFRGGGISLLRKTGKMPPVTVGLDTNVADAERANAALMDCAPREADCATGAILHRSLHNEPVEPPYLNPRSQ